MQNLQDLHCRMLTFQFMINVEKKIVEIIRENSGSCQNDAIQDNTWNQVMETISRILKILSGILAVVLLSSGDMVSLVLYFDLSGLSLVLLDILVYYNGLMYK